MKSSIDHVIHSATRKEDQELNILYLPYNGWNEWVMSCINIKVYMSLKALAHEWRCNHWPPNMNMLPHGVMQIPNRIDLDAIVCNFRTKQVFKAAEIARMYHIPLIMMDHELPSKTANENLKRYVNSRMPKNTIYVVPSETVKKEWCYLDESEVHTIPYGFHCPVKPLKNNSVLVVGDYSAEDRSLLHSMINCNTDVVAIGYNPGMTKEYSSFEEVLNNLKNSRIVITASQENKPPFIALLAMACGCAVITNRTRWTESIIEHEKNGMLFDKIGDISKMVKKLVDNPEGVRDMATHGRLLIEQDFNQQKYADAWASLLHKVSKRVYLR